MARKLTDKEYRALVKKIRKADPVLWRRVFSGKRGTLSKENVKALTDVGLGPMFCDRAEKRRDKCLEFKSWIEQHRREPSQGASDKTEKSWARWLCWIREAKAGKGTSKFYGFEEEVVGVPGLFDQKDLERERRERCLEVRSWIEKEGRVPNKKRYRDEEEKRLGNFIDIVRRAKQGSGTWTYHGFEEEVVGVPGLFDGYNKKAHRLSRIVELRAWMAEMRREPCKRSEDEKERSLALLVSNTRRAKAGGAGTYYGDEEEVVGVPGLFDSKDLERERRERCMELKAWIAEHDRLPSAGSKDAIEKSLGMFISSLRGAKVGNTRRRSRGTYTYYSFEEELVGIPGLFDMKKKKRA